MSVQVLLILVRLGSCLLALPDLVPPCEGRLLEVLTVVAPLGLLHDRLCHLAEVLLKINRHIVTLGLVGILLSWTDTAATWLFVVNNLGLLLHGHWDNFWWEMEIFSEVFNTFIGKGPVVMSPCELLLDQATGSQRLAGFD